ncbi:MAG: hypothetical protein ACP5N2_07345 [Candidatus Nanoarchaeia archaeon]
MTSPKTKKSSKSQIPDIGTLVTNIGSIVDGKVIIDLKEHPSFPDDGNVLYNIYLLKDKKSSQDKAEKKLSGRELENYLIGLMLKNNFEVAMDGEGFVIKHMLHKGDQELKTIALTNYLLDEGKTRGQNSWNKYISENKPGYRLPDASEFMSIAISCYLVEKNKAHFSKKTVENVKQLKSFLATIIEKSTDKYMDGAIITGTIIGIQPKNLEGQKEDYVKHHFGSSTEQYETKEKLVEMRSNNFNINDRKHLDKCRLLFENEYGSLMSNAFNNVFSSGDKYAPSSISLSKRDGSDERAFTRNQIVKEYAVMLTRESFDTKRTFPQQQDGHLGGPFVAVGVKTLDVKKTQ